MIFESDADLDGLRSVTNEMTTPLRPRVLLLLFSLYDPLETDSINIYSMIDELRDMIDFKPREEHVIRLFKKLDSQEISEPVFHPFRLSCIQLVLQEGMGF